jgi:hypothetical protein
VRALNRIELVAETLRAALNAIAGVAPEPLRVSRRRFGLDHAARAGTSL